MRFEKKLTDEEAEQLYRLLSKLDQEMNNRIVKGNAFETGEVGYTTVLRGKKRRYLEEVYDVGSD